MLMTTSKERINKIRTKRNKIIRRREKIIKGSRIRNRIRRVVTKIKNRKIMTKIATKKINKLKRLKLSMIMMNVTSLYHTQTKEWWKVGMILMIQV
jgi:hypothetical protein